jgi:hypothetical protein
MFQKKTLRQLPPDTRKLAVACNDAEQALRRWRRSIPQLASDERHWRADAARLEAQGRPDVSIPDQAVPCPEHGITRMVPDKCPGCNRFAIAWQRASLEQKSLAGAGNGMTLDGDPPLFG